jgi:hypothetical protein
MKAKALANAILEDRRNRKINPRTRTAYRVANDDFDPFAITRWRVIAGGNPGYLVATPTAEVRGRECDDGKVRGGFRLDCQHCGSEFESLGLAYCAKCMEKPAQDRRDRVRATRQPPVPAQKSRAFPRENGTEIIEEFPLIFGSADWPTFLIGPSSRRGARFSARSGQGGYRRGGICLPAQRCQAAQVRQGRCMNTRILSG